MVTRHRSITLLGAIFFALSLLFAAIASITLTDVLYPVIWTFDTPDHQAATHAIVSYIAGKVPELTVAMTPAEQSHLADVRTLVLQGKILFIIFLASLGVCFLALPLQLKELSSIVRNGALLAIVVTLLLLAGFGTAFQLFHELLFPQGNWMFPADSVLITLFPFQFFFRLVLGAFIVLLLLALGTLSLIAGMKRHHSRKQLSTVCPR